MKAHLIFHFQGVAWLKLVKENLDNNNVNMNTEEHISRNFFLQRLKLTDSNVLKYRNDILIK